MSIRSASIWMAVSWFRLVMAAQHDDREPDRDQPERGDVPGWVMITVMTAALVVAILIPFRTAIVTAVTKALSDVTGT